MTTLKGIVLSTETPSNTTVLWARPMGKGFFALYIFNNGKWETFRIADDKGTVNTADDELIDISQGGGGEGGGTEPADFDEKIRTEVARQLENFDDDAVNTRPSGDTKDYPMVDIIQAGETRL